MCSVPSSCDESVLLLSMLLLDIVHILELYCTPTCNTLVIPIYILSTGRPKRHGHITYPNMFSVMVS
jgi:hypothetical protein